jgi:hypothetical protein
MTPPASHGVTVHFSDPGQQYRYAAPSSVRAAGISDRFAAWVVIVLLFAASSLALYDLYLLLAGLR